MLLVYSSFLLLPAVLVAIGVKPDHNHNTGTAAITCSIAPPTHNTLILQTEVEEWPKTISGTFLLIPTGS